MDFQKQQILKLFKHNDIEALLFTKPESIFWYSEIKIDDAKLLVTKSKSYLLTDSRYTTYINNIKNKSIDEIIIIKNYHNDLFENISKILINQNYKKLVIENITTIKDYFILEKFLNNYHIQLSPIELENLFLSKSLDNVKNIKHGCKIIAKGIEHIKTWLKPGVTEKATAIELNNYFFKYPEVEKLSFDTIVAFGSNSALPHAIPSNNQLKDNDIILIDCGVMVNGYCSDQTRTFFINKPNPKLLEIYNIVLKVQEMAIKMVKPGITISTLDKKVRQYLTKKNYNQYFIHNLGHGLGTNIHEKPFLSSNNDDILDLNTVITIEPGIYIEGLGGIRIEDDLYVTKDGYEILNNSPKHLEILKK